MAGGTDWFKESFRQEYEQHSAAIGRFNLAIFGKTGVGKSTLVNAVFGEEVAATLPNARHLVAPALGHGVSLHGCGPRLVEQFIRKASAADLDARCLERIPRPLFVMPLGTLR